MSNWERGGKEGEGGKEGGMKRAKTLVERTGERVGDEEVME